MHSDDTFDGSPALEAQWHMQEAARRAGTAPTGRAALGDDGDGYARLFAVMVDAADLAPPADLPQTIAATVEARAEAMRAVALFRRSVQRWALLPLVALIVVCGASIGPTTLAQALAGPGWLYVPALALLAWALSGGGRRTG